MEKQYNYMRNQTIPLMSLFFILIFSIGLISASETSFTFTQNTVSEIIIPCIDSNEDTCTSSVACNISINYPNGSTMIENSVMEFKSLGNFNYTLAKNQTEVLGEYIVSRPCSDGSLSGFTRFAYLVTPTGADRPTTSEGIIVVVGIAVMTLFSLFFFNLSMRVGSNTASLAFVVISGLLLFTTTMFTITMISDNLSHLGSAMAGYETYLLIIKTIISISVTFLTLFALYKAYKMWGLKKGMRVD